MPDPQLAALQRQLIGFPGANGRSDDTEPAGASDAVWPFRIRHGNRTLAFLTTVAAFGTPLDITVSELVIDSFFPADAETAAFLRSRTKRRRSR